jgi:hypothetical protein
VRPSTRTWARACAAHRWCATSAELPALTPSRDLWSGIAERIETPVISLPQPQRLRAWNTRPARLAAAAVILVAATAGTTYMFTRNGNARDRVNLAAMGDTALNAPDSGASANNSARTAEPARAGITTPVAGRKDVPAGVTYDREITALRGVLELRRNDLDPATVAVLEHSLQTIDGAIADARAAIARDSASTFLHDQLNQALEKKLGLLRTVALLPPRA